MRLKFLGIWLAACVLAALAACGTPPQRAQFDSTLSYNATYNDTLGAMADQKLIFSEQDRLNGRIVGARDGETIVATLQPMQDGTLRVSFSAQGDSAAATALRQKVIASYVARTSNASMLGGFKDKGGDTTGPTPCPTAPAFCP